MKKVIFNILKYLALFAIGVLIFWLLYRKVEWEKLKGALAGLKYGWLILSIALNLLAQYSRALRWKMLIKPMGYNPSTWNAYLSVLALYFVNLIIPRAGEVARCSIINKTDKVPFTKLVGTVFTERLADMLMLFLLAFIIFTFNFSTIVEFFNLNPDIGENVRKFMDARYIILLIAFILLLVLAAFITIRLLRRSSKRQRLSELKRQFIDGIKSIAHMEHKWLFIGHTVFIFLMWLIMLYVVFLAYEPTASLSLRSGMVVFLMGGIAMIAPVQGGLGAWHGMVARTLLIYGIVWEEGLIFALVAHTTTNLIYIVIGGGVLLYLWIKFGKTMNLGLKKAPAEQAQSK